MTPPVTLKTQQLNQDEYKKPAKEKFNQVLQELANNVKKIETTKETVKKPKVQLKKYNNSIHDAYFDRVNRDRVSEKIEPEKNYGDFVSSSDEEK